MMEQKFMKRLSRVPGMKRVSPTGTGRVSVAGNLGSKQLKKLGTISGYHESSAARIGNMEMVEGKVSKKDFIKENKKVQSMVKDISAIRKNIDKLFRSLEDNMEDHEDTDRFLQDSEDYSNELIAQYWDTEREREEILQSLRLFFQSQIYFFKDEYDSTKGSDSGVSHLQNGFEEAEQGRFRDAWEIALKDIDRIKQINEQLFVMGKEIQSTITEKEAKPTADEPATTYTYANKVQLHQFREMFTNEAKINLKVTRDLSEMAKEISYLRHQNEQLVKEKTVEQKKASSLLKNIKLAERYIKELQEEVSKTNTKAFSTNASLRRMQRAYSSMKNKTFELEAKERQSSIAPTELPLIKPQKVDKAVQSSPIHENDKASTDTGQISNVEKNKATDQQSCQLREQAVKTKSKQGSKGNRPKTNLPKLATPAVTNKRSTAQATVLEQKQSGTVRNKKPSINFASQFSKNINKIKEKREALKNRPRLQFSRVSVQKLSFPKLTCISNNVGVTMMSATASPHSPYDGRILLNSADLRRNTLICPTTEGQILLNSFDTRRNTLIYPTNDGRILLNSSDMRRNTLICPTNEQFSIAVTEPQETARDNPSPPPLINPLQLKVVDQADSHRRPSGILRYRGSLLYHRNDTGTRKQQDSVASLSEMKIKGQRTYYKHKATPRNPQITTRTVALHNRNRQTNRKTMSFLDSWGGIEGKNLRNDSPTDFRFSYKHAQKYYTEKIRDETFPMISVKSLAFR